MPLIRRLLGPTLQEAFDLDRESGPRWLQQDAVYLFADPLQQGRGISETVSINVNDETASSGSEIYQLEDDEQAIIRAAYFRLYNNSGSDVTDPKLEVKLEIPDERQGHGLINLFLFSAVHSGTLGTWEDFRVVADDKPWLVGYRIPAGSKLTMVTNETSIRRTAVLSLEVAPASAHLAL